MSSDEEDAQVGDYYRGDLEAETQIPEQEEEDLDRLFPNRPRNDKPTFPFHTLYEDLFDPLKNNQKAKGPKGPTGRRAGPHGGPSMKPAEIRRAIVERFIARWRTEVGNDILPAMRLILPEKDKDRAMYGLKEKVLAKYLVKVMRIDKNSDDGFNLLNWKLPGASAATRSSGDFAIRCHEVLCKRAHLVEPGTLSIEEVNELLDKLAESSKEETQLPVIETFYKSMNADEMMWIVRIITKSMHIGMTEKVLLEIWHPDAGELFNVSSSLRRVCWDLYDPHVRLDGRDRVVQLGSCALPQLAQQPNMSFEKMVQCMRPTEEDAEFFIEEKLDGERMQLHMYDDPKNPGSKKFRFFSRKNKDYDYLYGKSFEDGESALTRHIRQGFKDGVENVILDGEMITWNTTHDAIVPFGSLKTAALKQKQDETYSERPFYRAFDVLLLNDHPLTQYSVRDRRKALERTINNVHRRIEILPYRIGTRAEDIENSLRDVVARASEGLVIKNPRSVYMLDKRLPDWCKVKPEYMDEYGESLDCLVIGGFYGSGHRGGMLSSFLCGLRVDTPEGKTQEFHSFFKVGGGMTSDDYAKIQHNTEGKWHKYDASRPPSEYILLGGPWKQTEKPDMWIKPEDSFVVEVKAASVNASEDYAVGVTLRFPRFHKFRQDKDWKTALSIDEFKDLQLEAEKELKEKKQKEKMSMRAKKRKTQASRKQQILVAGYDGKDANEAVFAQPQSNLFHGLAFYIMTECTKPVKKSKIEIEQLVKENGGAIVQSHEIKHKEKHNFDLEIICVAERRTVKVASLMKIGTKEIVRPIWLFDCIQQGKTDFAQGLMEMQLPMEIDRHIFFGNEERKALHEKSVDEFGDAYARDTTSEELKSLMAQMGHVKMNHSSVNKEELIDPDNGRGWMYRDLVFWFDEVQSGSTNEITQPIAAAKTTAQFAGARLVNDLNDGTITHVILHQASDKRRVRGIVAQRRRLPRIVSLDWVQECWNEHTRIVEERFAVI